MNLAQLASRQSPAGSLGVRARITVAPLDADDALVVEWAAPASDDVAEEGAPETVTLWVGNGRLPAVGDDALLIVDSVGDPWAIVAATGDQLWTAA